MIELTPEHLRSWGRQWGHVVQLQSYPSTGRVVKDAASKFADAWDRDLRVKNGAINFLKHKVKEVKEERDRLREALREIACSGPESRCHFLANQALAATTDSQVNPEKRDD